MYNMAFADLHGDVGFTVIGPHGSLISDLLGVIPRRRTNDVVVLDPAHHHARVLGINILESVRPGERHLVVSSVISTIRNLWPCQGQGKTPGSARIMGPRGGARAKKVKIFF